MTESPANATFGDCDNDAETYIDDGFCIMDPDPSEVIAQTLIHSIICGFGLIGNVLVMVTYIFYKRTKTMTDVYLFNVAVADLIFVATLPFVIYNEQHDWSMGRAACKVLRSSYSINLYSGMLLLACISCDRGVNSAHAHQLNQTETAALVKLLVPSLQMAVGFLLPLCVMAFCCSSIIYTLLRAQSNQRHKAVRVVLAVVVVFIVCHLPYNVTLLIHTLSLFKQRSCDAENLKLKFLNICRTVAYLHCCLNPFLYAFVGVKFRNHFRQIMLDLWCFSKRYIYTARSSRGTSEICMSELKSSEGSNNMSSFSA
ncbi:unnamed protein product [Oreochromis niloticus]|nr:unnamed protein product [Mustela putorius furo]